jgi:hypothetical protein
LLYKAIPPSSAIAVSFVSRAPFAVISLTVTVKVVQRATAGVSWRSQRQMQAEEVAVAVA